MSYHLGEAAAPARLGRYELIGQLATGGMAEIHLAKLAGEAGFEKIVVVKRLLPELVASKAFVAMLLDEGKLAARLDHPNVCEVFELGRDGAEYFLVMPYLDGVPATDFIARPRDPDRLAQLRVACGIVVQACAGLHHAHELRGGDGEGLGLVHRDVSPSNLFVTTAGVVKVLDFGIAKVRGATETEAGTIKGKTQYMAPEQLLGEELDRRCDVFALGIVLFELATHQRLFKRASDYLAARAILEEEIPRADAVDPAVPAALADVIAKAMERKKEERYADAREVARAVEAAMGGVAGAEEIAAALAEWHGAELSAMRTRQARVIGDARSQLATAPRGGVGSQVATARRRTAGRARAVAAVAGIGVVVATAGMTWWMTARPAAEQEKSAAVTVGGSGGGGRLTVGGSGSGSGDGGARNGSNGATDTVTVTDPVTATAHRPPPTDPVTATATTTARPVARDGRFSIESTPYATIFVDGRKLGVTPLVHQMLPAGRHRVRAVLDDGRSKDLTIDVPAGKQAKPVHLSW